MNSSNAIKIKAENVSKSFSVGIRKNQPALFRLVSSVSGKEPKREVKALMDVSLEVKEGEVLGIVGKNGSGKSTLLRIIAGIFSHDSGTVEASGHLAYVSSFSQGLKEKLTMKENIFLSGAIMGLQRSDIERIFDDIVNFSGLADFVDAKLHQFSTGMSARLAFSIAVHCLEFQNPDILLLDEALSAGGDIDFQRKAGERIASLVRRGAAVVIVSHNLNDIRRHSDRVMWIDAGKVKAVGNPEEILLAYEQA